MADAPHSKCGGGDPVRVRIPLPAPLGKSRPRCAGIRSALCAFAAEVPHLHSLRGACLTTVGLTQHSCPNSGATAGLGRRRVLLMTAPSKRFARDELLPVIGPTTARNRL